MPTVFDVKQKIAGELEKKIYELGTGAAFNFVTDASALHILYSHCLGMVAGLRQAVAIIDGMEKDENQPKPKDVVPYSDI